MSVIAVTDCGEYLLFAADSQVTDSGGMKLTRQKLAFLPDRPLAWGFAGDEGIGRKFDDWLSAYPWPEETSWETLGEAAIAELSRLNGRTRDMARLARVEPTSDDFVVVLIAGRANGRRPAAARSWSETHLDRSRSWPPAAPAPVTPEAEPPPARGRR